MHYGQAPARPKIAQKSDKNRTKSHKNRPKIFWTVGQKSAKSRPKSAKNENDPSQRGSGSTSALVLVNTNKRQNKGKGGKSEFSGKIGQNRTKSAKRSAKIGQNLKRSAKNQPKVCQNLPKVCQMVLDPNQRSRPKVGKMPFAPIGRAPEELQL